MPFYVIRRTFSVSPGWEYVSKSGVWHYDFRKARIFSSMGAVKNSILHWAGTGDNDAEIVELELSPTGKSITVGLAMAPLQERRLKEVLARREREAQEQRERELDELKRLKAKYPEEK